NIGFWIGRRGGRWLLELPGPLRHHRERVLARGEEIFQRHGGKTVFFGRWFSGLRIASAWLAGVNRMSWPTFLVYNAAGGIAWAIAAHHPISYFQAIVLGLVQGVAEPFPISSLGHGVILPRLAGWNIHQNDKFFLTFLVATHLATAIVLFIFFWRDWVRIFRGL